MYKVVLIDMDNTILNFDKAEEKALKTTVDHYGFTYSNELVQRYDTINTSYWRRLERKEISMEYLRENRFKEVFQPLTDKKINGLEMDQYYLEDLSHNVFYEDDALEILKYLRSKYKVIIVSNGITFVQKGRIAISHMDEKVDGIILSQEVGYAKPDRNFFINGLKEFGLDANKIEDYIIIGDSLTSDMKSAENMGYASIYYNRKSKPIEEGILSNRPTYEIHHLSELKDIL